MTSHTKPMIDRFMSYVDRRDGHWLWTGGCNTKGRPLFWDGGSKTKVSATRWSYEYFIGPIPPGHDAHHLCVYKHCVRPMCLEIVPGDKHPDDITFINGAKTHCPQDHEYTEENTYHDRNNKRGCKTCKREWRRAHIWS